MKKLNTIALFLIIFPLPLFATNNIHYKGELIAGACTLVINGDVMTTVSFQTLGPNNFSTNGQTERVPFILSLKDCNTALSTGVEVKIIGMEDTNTPGLLALEKTSTASGFSIGIESSDQRPLILNSTQGVVFEITEGVTSINLKAWLQKHPKNNITPGEFSSTAEVEFAYQ